MLKIITIINTVMILAIFGWLIYSNLLKSANEPLPIPAEAEYVRVGRLRLETDTYTFVITDIVETAEVIDVIGVYSVYNIDEIGLRFIDNMTIYRVKSDYGIVYVVVRP